MRWKPFSEDLPIGGDVISIKKENGDISLATAPIEYKRYEEIIVLEDYRMSLSILHPCVTEKCFWRLALPEEIATCKICNRYCPRDDYQFCSIQCYKIQLLEKKKESNDKK
jgi:hypothetical protein